ncbi:DUF4177 domain-containing protein [Enterococcus faecalis]|uniref:hypothetical protein n=1 Tax=Enterococcus faecalis TaxID=1351 RepID=UPI002DBD97FC|nr:hypothetical protein [Enterococcus faecalis]MEB7954572.1 DUF4177 domain-containing protein [Enterococcus faecalis]MEB7964703.1 DUF4177 domain-containing protein [Enterococcus faecalis]
MKEYIFEKVTCSTSHGGAKISFEDHRDKIIAFAQRGLCYVGWLPRVMDGYGHIKEIDLIFEKQREDM